MNNPLKNQNSGDTILNYLGASGRRDTSCVGVRIHYTTKPVGEGTGLGLSIVHTIVRESDMTIEIDSRPDEGSAFRVIMPVAG